MGRLTIALVVTAIALPVYGQPQRPIAVQFTDTEITEIIDAGSKCLEKEPYACAGVLLYLRNKLTVARQTPAPKPVTPEEKKEPSQ